MPPVPERPRSVHTPDGGIVLDIKNGKIFSLNASGSRIFQLLEQGVPREQIVEDLVRHFGIPAETANADLNEFSNALKDRALLTTIPKAESE